MTILKEDDSYLHGPSLSVISLVGALSFIITYILEKFWNVSVINHPSWFIGAAVTIAFFRVFVNPALRRKFR